ncbi:MAG: SHOCT domain-containing protein [Ruminococcus sp.]|nr:SHOCT domain-containing protein [Ruminococcus sp.]
MDAVYWILLIVWGLVWGACARQCVLDKGYEDEGGKYFAIGFFLGLLGFILAYAKPDMKKQYMDQQFKVMMENQNRMMSGQSAPPRQAAAEGGWRCTCGEMNKDYEGSCHNCYKTRAEVKMAEKAKKEAREAEKAAPPQTQQASVSDQLRDFKAMLDEGLITEEEYNAKKKQLLGL